MDYDLPRRPSQASVESKMGDGYGEQQSSENWLPVRAWEIPDPGKDQKVEPPILGSNTPMV